MHPKRMENQTAHQQTGKEAREGGGYRFFIERLAVALVAVVEVVVVGAVQ